MGCNLVMSQLISCTLISIASWLIKVSVYYQRIGGYRCQMWGSQPSFYPPPSGTTRSLCITNTPSLSVQQSRPGGFPGTLLSDWATLEFVQFGRKFHLFTHLQVLPAGFGGENGEGERASQFQCLFMHLYPARLRISNCLATINDRFRLQTQCMT